MESPHSVLLSIETCFVLIQYCVAVKSTATNTTANCLPNTHDNDFRFNFVVFRAVGTDIKF